MLERLFALRKRNSAADTTSPNGVEAEYHVVRLEYGDGRSSYWPKSPGGHDIQVRAEPWVTVHGKCIGEIVEGEPHPLGSLELALWRIERHRKRVLAETVVSSNVVWREPEQRDDVKATGSVD